MRKRRLLFNEFIVPAIKGFEQTVDKDSTTDYLFIKAPKDKYTLYFDSGMPIYDQGILNGCKEGGVMEFKFIDRKISLYCPSRINEDGNLWFFNLEFNQDSEEILILPGQVILNSVQTIQNLVDKKCSFINVLEQIKLINNAN